MTMKKQWCAELRQLQKQRTRLATAFTKTTKHLFVEMTRAERTFDKQTKHIDRHIAILEARLS